MSAPANVGHNLPVTVKFPGNTETPTQTVTILDGTKSATFTVRHSDYAAMTGDLAIEANLVDGDRYTLGNPATATATFPALPVVTIEPGGQTETLIKYVLRLNRRLDRQFTVYYNVEGIDGSQIFNAGDLSRTTEIARDQFPSVPVARDVEAVLVEHPTYTRGNPASATVSLPSNETTFTIARIVPTTITSETTSVTFRISASQRALRNFSLVIEVDRNRRDCNPRAANSGYIKRETITFPVGQEHFDYIVDKSLFRPEHFDSGDVNRALTFAVCFENAGFRQSDTILALTDNRTTTTIPGRPNIAPSLTVKKRLDAPAPRNSRFSARIFAANGLESQIDSTITLEIPANESESPPSRTFTLTSVSDFVTITDNAVAGFTPQKAECTVSGGPPITFPLSASNRKFTIQSNQLTGPTVCTLFNTVDRTITITAPPEDSVTAGSDSVTFTLTAAPAAPAGGLTVKVELPGNTDMPTTTVNFVAGADEATLPVPRSGYAATTGAFSIKANLDDGDGYTLGNPATATATFPAFPVVTIALEEANGTVLEEGGEVTLTVTATGLQAGESLTLPIGPFAPNDPSPLFAQVSIEPSEFTVTGAAPTTRVTARLGRLPGKQPNSSTFVLLGGGGRASMGGKPQRSKASFSVTTTKR